MVEDRSHKEQQSHEGPQQVTQVSAEQQVIGEWVGRLQWVRERQIHHGEREFGYRVNLVGNGGKGKGKGRKGKRRERWGQK